MPEDDAERLVDESHEARRYPFRRPGQSAVAYSDRQAVMMCSHERPILRSRKHAMDGEHADDLLKRALIDAEAAASVALRVTPLSALRGADRGLPRPQGPRDDPDLRRPRRPRGRRRRRQGRADARAAATSTWPRPRTARRPSTCSPSRPARCATRWSAPTPCSTSGASRSRTSSHDHIRVDRRLQPRRAPARAPAAADRARLAREADRRDRRLQRPLARPRAARRWGSPSASRTSCASIRCRTTRSAASTTSSSSPPSTRASWPSRSGRQEASVQRFLELSGEDFPQTG